MALSRIVKLVNSLESIDEQEKARLIKELERQSFMFKRIEKDKSIAINILKASIKDLEENQAIMEEKNRQLSEQKKIIEKNTALLEENLRKLELSYKELQQFSYIVSHDLKSPLRTISSFAQILREEYRDQLDDAANEYVDLIITGTFQMDRVIRALLDYARVGHRSERFVDTDLNEVVDLVKLHLKKEIQDHHAQISCEHLPTVFGNKTAFIQLFQNLTSNAIKFRAEESPKIQISCHSKRGQWYFRFADNGIGIEEEYREKIFLPFQRLSEKPVPGTGMGLAICKKVVKMHRGEIYAEAGRTGGTAFVFTLPHQGVSESVAVS
ncbi:MAG: ATP-binding protein [Bacteroidota bacterium]